MSGNVPSITLPLIACLFLTTPASAFQDSGTLSAEQREVDFANDVLPIFRTHCHSCHGLNRQESNYRLDLRTSALGSGDFGDPPIVAGNAAASPLIEYVAGSDDDFVMPPPESGKALSPEQVATLRDWIDQGAKWPDELAGDDSKPLTTDHWSFQPIRPAVVPEPAEQVFDNFPIRNGIDYFVANRLQQAGLRPSDVADHVTLIRRMHLDMHGLLPVPQAVSSTPTADADSIDSIVDELLDSHHYGERWARHWLDVVRFAESTGYEVNRDRANAWYYRDFVIDSLNADKPYDQFIREQLAGDLLGADIGTGFLVGGPHDIVKSPDINLTQMQRQDELADYVNTTSTTFLGLTVGCARCHNHKFDPILQRDYYALQAIFAGVSHGERKLVSVADPNTVNEIQESRNRLARAQSALKEMKASAPSPESLDSELLPAVNTKQNTDTFEPRLARFVRFAIGQTNSVEPCIDELEIYAAGSNQNLALAAAGAVASSSGDYANDPKHQLKHINDGKYGNPNSWIANTIQGSWVQIELPEPVEVDRVVWGRDRDEVFSDRLPIEYFISVSEDGEAWERVFDSTRRAPYLINGEEPEGFFISRLDDPLATKARVLLAEIHGLRKRIQANEQKIPTAYVGTFGKAPVIHRLYRGDPMSPREEVAPDTLSVMGSLDIDAQTPESERRLALANWIASSDNPLTARIIVNRVWHYHFGTGLVATPSDFGLNGAAPSHPDLLDWLARQFMENGWSLKWLHRQILMSSTYRQSSQPRVEAIRKDADARLLWRFPPRRLEAEAIRDCVLQLSGKLNPEAGGPGFLLFDIDRENVHHYFPLKKFEPQHFRRMIYMTKIRQEQDDVFGSFDCPDGGQTIPKRNRSTTPLQALALLNSQFVLEQANFLAERLVAVAGDSQQRQIRLAFFYAYSRLPTDEELQDAMELVEQHGLPALCRALMNSNEFLFMS